MRMKERQALAFMLPPSGCRLSVGGACSGGACSGETCLSCKAMRAYTCVVDRAHVPRGRAGAVASSPSFLLVRPPVHQL